MKVVRQCSYYRPAPTQQKTKSEHKTILYQGSSQYRQRTWMGDRCNTYVKDAQLLIIGSGDIQQQLEEKGKRYATDLQN